MESPIPGAVPAGTAPAAPAANLRTVFAGLMLGLFLGAVSQTIIAPAMPRIVAELGGMAHYSWIAVSALLASTVTVPVVGKLSDLYGRKAFYVGGIVVFMASSLVAGWAPSFNAFLLARVLEGVGMGTMMPLSQAIIGDLVPPRQRGKYQGWMGAVFGLASVVGPFLGGWITDHLGWRWLFFVNLPLGLVALGFIVPFMKLPHQRHEHSIDYAGFVTLTLGLTSTLLATVWGGTEYAWGSPQIVGLFAFGAAMLGLFVLAETRAAEPVLPLRLWKNDIFTSANLATFGVSMAMFGAIFFIPVFVQGVLGASVLDSGVVLMPLMLANVLMSIATGLLITRTGRYKRVLLLGIGLVAVGFYLLTRLGADARYGEVVRTMILVGLGLGAAMQTFVLVVQNAVAPRDLGVATAAVQLSRSIGASVGTAVLGTVMTQRMAREMAHLLPAGASLGTGGGAELGANSVLDPAVLATLPPALLEAIRTALADALHPVFVAALPAVALAFVAALFIREIPLRRTVHADATEAGKELLAELNQAGADDSAPVLGAPNPAYRGRAGFVGLVFALLADEVARDGRGRLQGMVARLGGGEPQRGRERLDRVACALLREGEDEDDDGSGAPAGRGGVGSVRGRPPIDAQAEFERALAERSPELRQRLGRLLTEREADPAVVLTPDDLAALERIGVAMAAALLLDLAEEAPA